MAVRTTIYSFQKRVYFFSRKLLKCWYLKLEVDNNYKTQIIAFLFTIGACHLKIAVLEYSN